MTGKRTATPRAPAAPRARAKTKAAPKPGPKPGLKISDDVLLRSRVSRKDNPQLHSPFDRATIAKALHPPTVAGKSAMAMDESIGDTLTWAAASTFGGAWAEGLGFFGYAYLAELAQRPEYRRMSERLATEMTRKFAKLKAAGDDDKTDKIKKIEDAFERLGVREAFRKAALHDGHFGRSHLFLDFGNSDPDELKTPIGDGRAATSKMKVEKGSLTRIKSVEPLWCYPLNYNSNDPLSPDWYKPTTWMVMGKAVHESRLLTFIGREVPDLLKPAYSFGGLSLSQMAKPYVDYWLKTRDSVGDIVSAFSVMVLKTNMAQALGMGGDGDQLFKRAEFFNNLRDNRGLMMVDKDTEDFLNVSAPLGTLDMLQAQAQEHMGAVSGIPLVVLIGIQPAGLNASSEGEIRVFYDWVRSYQSLLFDENFKRVLAFVQLSEFGEVDPGITHDWEPLYELTAAELATKRKTEADTDAIYIDAGVLDAPEARRRLAADPDSPYAGLDPDDAPELPDPAEVLEAAKAAGKTNGAKPPANGGGKEAAA
jgi:phage-related protein (TIGR01555 family)